MAAARRVIASWKSRRNQPLSETVLQGSPATRSPQIMSRMRLLQLVRQRLDEVRAAERIGDTIGAGLELDDLLGAQAHHVGVVAGRSVGLVEARDLDGLDPSERQREALHRTRARRC